MASSTADSRSYTQPASTASTKTSHLPAPSLFVGPRSRNASQLSITRTTTHNTASTLNNNNYLNPNNPTTTSTSTPNPHLTLPNPLSRHPTNNTTTTPSQPRTSTAGAGGITIHTERHVEEKWKKIQATLNEVELVAQSSTHVFGAEHAERLDGLRMAQIELARAWGRSASASSSFTVEGRDFGRESSTNEGRNGSVGGKGSEEIGGSGPGSGTVGSGSFVSTALSGEEDGDWEREDGDGEVFVDAEEETATDIRLAGERRAANEAYFKRVDERVRDVVLKLEGVAEAMRSMEAESRSLWSSEDSLENNDGARKGKP